MDGLDLSASSLDAAVRGVPPSSADSSLPAPMRNNNPGALMPGGQLASFSTPEEGLQALDQNLQRYGKSGVNTLRGVISKWAPQNENNTEAYIAHASRATGLNPDQPIDLSSPYTRLQLAAAIVQHENGTKALYRTSPQPTQPAAARSSAPQAASTDPGDFSAASMDQAVKGALASVQSSQKPSAPQDQLRLTSPEALNDTGSQIRATAANFATGLGANIVGGYRGLSTLLTAPWGHKLDDAANDVNDYVRDHTYQGSTAPQREAVASFTSPDNPINWPVVGVDKASDYVADKFGPVAGTVAKTVGTGSLLALGLRGKPGTAPVDVGPSRPGVGVYRPLAVGENPSDAIFSRSQPRPAAPADGTQAQPPSTGAGRTPQATAGATPSQARPQAPDVVNQPTGRAEPTAAPESAFPEVNAGEPLGNIKAPTDEMNRRAQVLQSVGIDQARESSLTGDKIGGSTDVQISKEDSPRGRFMLDQLTKEKQALADHATKLVEDTGGTLDKDQTTAWHRGDTIVAPLDQLRFYYDKQASALYQAADERAQGVPASLGKFQDLLGDESERTNSDRINLQTSAQAYAKKLGMLQDDGSISGTAMQAETFRKWLNENRNGANGRYVDKLKDALDDDVMSSAGEDLYSQARALWRQKKQTLDNPDGIAKLTEADGPDGINRAIPKEQIAPKLARMPVDQFGHVVDTLRNVPDEIKPAATSALNEIRAHFANQVRNVGAGQAGQWNANGVLKYLRENAARMNQVFTPEEMGRFQNLNEAGQILAKDQSYPGASVQQHNLARAAAAGAVRNTAGAAGAVVGHATLGPVGATLGYAAGKAVGEKAASGITDKAALKATQRRTVKLSDLLQTR